MTDEQAAIVTGGISAIGRKATVARAKEGAKIVQLHVVSMKAKKKSIWIIF
jgi:NAD(P)-dependent dehydrogenase (short-subunit alcohol dehydrogenase family)